MRSRKLHFIQKKNEKMVVNGITVPEHIINKSVNAIRKRGGEFNSEGLKLELISNGVPLYIAPEQNIADVLRGGYQFIAHPAACRIIQRLKKQGSIKNVYGGGSNTVWQWKEATKKREKKESQGGYTSEQLITLYHNAIKNSKIHREKELEKDYRVRAALWERVAKDYLKQIQERVRNHKGEVFKYAKKVYGEKVWMQGDVIMINYTRMSNNLLMDKKLLSSAGHKIFLNKTK